MKTWKEVKVGDYIYYYDHCTMRKQLVHSVNLETYVEEHVDWYNPRRKTVEEKERLTLVVGPKNITVKLENYELNRSEAFFWGIHRFASKECAQNFFKKLLDKRIKKANYLKEKLDQTLGILAKYEKNNKDFEV